jgi:hypothetical protein
MLFVPFLSVQVLSVSNYNQTDGFVYVHLRRDQTAAHSPHNFKANDLLLLWLRDRICDRKSPPQVFASPPH